MLWNAESASSRSSRKYPVASARAQPPMLPTPGRACKHPPPSPNQSFRDIRIIRNIRETKIEIFFPEAARPSLFPAAMAGRVPETPLLHPPEWPFVILSFPFKMRREFRGKIRRGRFQAILARPGKRKKKAVTSFGCHFVSSFPAPCARSYGARRPCKRFPFFVSFHIGAYSSVK